MTSEIVIHTERLVLRHARDDDLAMVYAIMSDPEVLRYWSTLPHESLGQTREWLNCMIARNASGNPDFLIEHNGQIIGKMGAYAMPEFGFYLAKAAQRQGFATEAMDAFIAHIFDGISDYLTADVDPRNHRSLTLLQRFGFVETGRVARTWEVGGEWCDSVYLRLDKTH